MIAPAWAMTTSRPVGSVMTAMSPVAPARIAASMPWPPSSSDGTLATRISPSRRSSRPASRIARTAARIDATPPFMSHAPRPNSRSPSIAADHGSSDHVARSPTGTTSTCPTSTIRRAARPADPPEDDRQALPRHLLARPVGVGTDLRGIRLDPLHAAADLGKQRRHPVLHRALVAGDARDPDDVRERVDRPARLDRVDGPRLVLAQALRRSILGRRHGPEDTAREHGDPVEAFRCGIECPRVVGVSRRRSPRARRRAGRPPRGCCSG